MYDEILLHKLKKHAFCWESILYLTYCRIHTKFYRYIHHCPSFQVNRPVGPFNTWRKYFYRSQAQVFWDERRRGLIGNSFRLRHFYVSPLYNWIWYFQLPYGAWGLHPCDPDFKLCSVTPLLYISSSFETQERLGDASVPYSTFESFI